MRPDPLIGHPTCDMDLQRRIRETRRDAVSHAVGRRKGRRRSLLDRVLGREPGDRPVTMDADALRDHGDDVWKSLRF